MILGILVTYNPDIEELKANLYQIVSQVNKLVVFDNHSDNIDEIQKLSISLKFDLILNNHNSGLGVAYNTVLKRESKKYKYFVTFDQDTLIPDNTIYRLELILENDSLIGVVGPLYSSETSLGEFGKLVKKHVIIQSCALFRMDLYNCIGGFNEQYFIDSIDFEYCLRILSTGYKVIRCHYITIKHNLGNSIPLIGNIDYTSHNNLRVYYMSRNHWDLTKKYFVKYPFFIMKKNLFFIVDMLKIIFLERDFIKLRFMINGLIE